MALALASAACSTRTPRDGFTVAQGPGFVGGSTIPVAGGEEGGTLDTAPGGDVSAPGVGSRPGARQGGTSGTVPGGGPAAAGEGDAAEPGDQPGAGSAAATGVTADSVTVSVAGPFDGAIGPVGNKVFEAGIGVWAKDVNSRGGIHGRRVVVKKVNLGETADSGIAACKEIRTNGSLTGMVTVALGDGSSQFVAADCLEKAGKVNLSYVTKPDPTWKRTFTYLPPVEDQGYLLAQFVKNVMGDGNKRLGLIYVNNALLGASKDGYVRGLRDMGIELVATEVVEPNQGSFTPQVLRLQQAGVDSLAIIATIEAIGILRDMTALNYRPRITGVHWSGDFIAKAARNTADGAYQLRLGATTDVPRYQQYAELARRHGIPDPDGDSFLWYGMGLYMEHMLTQAGPNLNEETLARGMETVGHYDNGIMPTISYSPDNHIGTRAMFPTICCQPDYSWKGLGPPRQEF